MAALAATSSAVVAASALDPGPIRWNYDCRLQGDGGALSLNVGPEGIVPIDVDGNRDVTTVRNIEGDPTVGVGIGLVRRGAAPLTVRGPNEPVR